MKPRIFQAEMTSVLESVNDSVRNEEASVSKEPSVPTEESRNKSADSCIEERHHVSRIGDMDLLSERLMEVNELRRGVLKSRMVLRDARTALRRDRLVLKEQEQAFLQASLDVLAKPLIRDSVAIESLMDDIEKLRESRDCWLSRRRNIMDWNSRLIEEEWNVRGKEECLCAGEDAEEFIAGDESRLIRSLRDSARKAHRGSPRRFQRGGSALSVTSR